MAIESWQIIHIIGAFLGLLVGWRLNAWLGTAFILAFVIAVEVFSWKKKVKRIGSESEGKPNLEA